jgi:hypothetical protein
MQRPMKPKKETEEFPTFARMRSLTKKDPRFSGLTFFMFQL